MKKARKLYQMITTEIDVPEGYSLHYWFVVGNKLHLQFKPIIDTSQD